LETAIAFEAGLLVARLTGSCVNMLTLHLPCLYTNIPRKHASRSDQISGSHAATSKETVIFIIVV
jgi:hypothetical protein